MNRRFALLALAALLAARARPLPAQEEAGIVARWRADPQQPFAVAGVMLGDLAHQARPLVVFADDPLDESFVEQLRLIAAGAADLAERDVIVLVDADPAGRSDARLRLRPRGFSLVLIDKDGTVVFRKPAPWDAREIGRQIDKLPSRLREVRG
ncbi:MAG: DUF4174 domain-containing protein [Rubellimicrobium sp.]|nr:DUF4174 domain-containing protein [Rubellimicrobium sp.]